MTIDWTINLGHIITLVGTLIAFITWGQGVKFQISSIERRVAHIESQVTSQTQLMITTSVLTDRLAYAIDRMGALEKRIELVESHRLRQVVK